MKTKPQLLLVILSLVVVGIVCFTEARRGNHYKVGMTVKEVLTMTGGRYPVKRYGVDYDNQPTPKQMNEDALYFIYDEKTGVLLDFNHHEILIHKERTKWFGVNVIKLVDSIRK